MYLQNHSTHAPKFMLTFVVVRCIKLRHRPLLCCAVLPCDLCIHAACYAMPAALLWMIKYDAIDSKALDKTIDKHLISNLQLSRSTYYYNVVIILCIGNGFSGDRHHD
jgi:hypothetical protein